MNFGDILDNVMSVATPQFTIEMWVKRDTINSGQVLLSKYEAVGNQRSWWFQFNSFNKLQFNQSVGGGTTTAGITSDDAITNITDWQYVAFTLDYSQVSYTAAGKIYLNGASIPLTASTPTKNAFFNSTSQLSVGALNTTSTPISLFNGQIRNIVVTNRVKPASEILSRFNYGNLSEPSATNLEFYTDFKTDTFSTNWSVKDLSPNIYNGASVNMIEGNRTCQQVEILVNGDMNFTNGIVYSVESDYSKRSTASEFNFNYTGTLLWLRAKVISAKTILIMIDGALHQELTVVDGLLYQITLPVGAKYVQLIEGAVATNAIAGTWLNNIIYEPSKFSKVTQGNVTDRFVFLGDSITQGSAATYTSLQGYSELFKYLDSKPVTVLGFGGGLLRDFVDLVPTSIDTTMSWLTDAFANTTGRKVLTIMLGTNDWADGYSAAAVNTRYNTLLDRINSDFPTIEVFCISPTYRVGEDAVMTTIRANILASCSARAWVTGIDGTSIINGGDLADTVHPTTAGHLKIHDAIDSTIL